MAKEKTNDRPTIEQIKGDLYEKCKEYYSGLKKAFENDDTHYELDFKDKLNMPTEFAADGIVLPTARDMVDTFVDHIDLANARIIVSKKTDSAISAVEAEMMKKFYHGIIYMTNVMSSISPWRVGGKHYGLYGLSVFKTVWDADRWIDKPEQNEGESEDDYAARLDEWRVQTHESLPIVIQAINPTCVMPDPETGGLGYVFEVRENSVFSTMERWPLWSNPEDKKLSDKTTQISWWSKKYRCELIDGEPILKTGDGIVPHKYGFIPYTFIDSGLGNISSDNDPVKRYVGALRYIYDLLVSESRSYSISEVVLKHEAWPTKDLEGENTGAVTDYSSEYGALNRLPAGVKIVERTHTMPPDALNAHMFRTSDYIAAHAAPRSVRGLSEQGVRSGADRRLVIAEAASRYQYATEAFKHGTANVLIKCAKLMKNVIPGDIRVWARTPTDEFDIEIDKSKMKEPFTCYVEFAPISEEDEYRRHDDLERLTASGIITRQWARTQMSNVDPIAMERDEERERIKNDPAVQQATSQYIAGKMAEALAKRSAAESITNPPPSVPPMGGQPPSIPQGGTSGVPRQMIPPIPNMPPLGGAQDLQNQMQAMRRPVPINQQGQGGGGNR